jgi:hypothetical protein
MSLSRNLWLNVGIGVLACASGIALYVTRDLASPEGGSARSPDLLPEFRNEDATRLEIAAGGQKLRLERTLSDGGSAAFSLLEPVKELADAATVDKFLSALAGARVVRPVAPGPPLSTLGLDPPRLTVALGTAKRSYRLALGGSAATPEGAHYLQISRDGTAPSVVVVSKALAEDLAVPLEAFRIRSLVTVNEAEVTRIVIKGPELALSLRRKTSTQFVIDGEPPMRADRTRVTSLFFQLSRLSASSFLPMKDAEAALGPEPVRIEIETQAATPLIRLEAGGSCPSDPTELVVIRRSPDLESACATRELEATLRLSKQDFADRHPFSLHTDEVEELRVSFAKGQFALVRKGSGFILHAHTETEVELEAGNRRIQDLLEAEGDRVDPARLSELGLDPASGTVTLRSSAARDANVIEEIVRVGNEDAQGNRLLYRAGDGVVLRVPHEQARAFALDSTLLETRKLSNFGPSSFVSAEIERPSGTQRLRRGTNQELVLESPKGFEPDGVLSSELIQTLGALSAERFVADKDDGSFGLSHSSLSVRFAFKDGDGRQLERNLRFGDETALGVFATLADAGPVFVLPRAVKDTCDLLLVDRQSFPTNAQLLSDVALEAHGRTLRLTRQGDHFSAVPSGAIPHEKVADLLEALANLRAEAGLHLGPARPAEGLAKPTLTVRLTPRVGLQRTLTFGAGDSWRSTSIFYLRVSGVDATFVIAQSKVFALRDAL